MANNIQIKPAMTNDDLPGLKSLLQALKDNEEEIKKAQRAGIPIEGALERNREEMAKVRKIINSYFPGQG